MLCPSYVIITYWFRPSFKISFTMNSTYFSYFFYFYIQLTKIRNMKPFEEMSVSSVTLPYEGSLLSAVNNLCYIEISLGLNGFRTEVVQYFTIGLGSFLKSSFWGKVNSFNSHVYWAQVGQAGPMFVICTLWCMCKSLLLSKLQCSTRISSPKKSRHCTHVKLW